ncbi:MAG: CBS domain-containing protein [Bacteroidota bacterium]|jgi:CBS domain-containing protein
MKKIADIFKRKGTNNIVIPPDEPVLNALKIMAENNIGSVVVMNGQQYMGLITERDYARKVILHGKTSSELTVGEIMSSFLPKASLQSTIEECMEVMTNHNIRYLPVFEEDTYIGVVSIIDVVKETIHAQKNTIEDLQNYINFAG